MSTPDRLGRNWPNPTSGLCKLWDLSGSEPKIVELAATDARDALQRSPEIFLWALPGETAPLADNEPMPADGDSAGVIYG